MSEAKNEPKAQLEAVPLDCSVRGDATDPVCGNCGNPLTQHYVESHPREGQRIYCNTFTNGDLFTSEPQESVIMDMLVDQHPDIYDGLINKWKIENGHAPNAEVRGEE